MATAFGKIEDLHFDENEEEFDACLERLEQFFVANGLSYDDDKEKTMFLTVVGRKNNTLLMDLCAPLKPSVKKLSELIDLMRKHFVPKTNFFAERYKFNSRDQREDESISEYMASLRKVAATCKFGAFLDDALRDGFSRAEIVYWPVACATATTDIPWHMPFWNGNCRSETVTTVLKR